MLEVVQRINNDLSSRKLHISNTKQVHCTSGTDYNAHTVSEKWPPTQQRNTSFHAKPKQPSMWVVLRNCVQLGVGNFKLVFRLSFIAK